MFVQLQMVIKDTVAQIFLALLMAVSSLSPTINAASTSGHFESWSGSPISIKSVSYGVEEVLCHPTLDTLKGPLDRKATFVRCLWDRKISQVASGRAREAEWSPRLFRGRTQEVPTSQ